MTLADAVSRMVGSPLVALAPVTGGDISQASRGELADGKHIFVKHKRGADPSMFRAEARGLRWLGAGGGLPVPAVLAAADDILVLEWIEPGSRRASTDDAIGRGLALLHRSGADLPWGLDHDNFIGTLPQDNRTTADWAGFWRERRLLPQLAGAARLLPVGLRRDLDRLLDRIDALTGPPEAPARLHGDLWGGNLLVDERGEPWLIDPAAYAGHREADLAMMLLFGGFGPRVFAAYEEVWPLQVDWRRRVPLYQLYYLLVHVKLFGQSYVGGVRSAVAALD